LDYSWFLIFALLTWMLGGSYYPAEFKKWSPALRYKVPVRSITLFRFGGVA